MAMVRTPNYPTKKSKNRPSLDAPGSSPVSARNSLAEENLKVDMNDWDTVIEETRKKVKKSIYLLNQTRNMKGELKVGIADNLTAVLKQLQKIIMMDDKQEKRTVEMYDAETQCETQCETQYETRIEYNCNCFETVKTVLTEFKKEYRRDLKEIRDHLTEAALRNVESINTKIGEEKERVVKTVTHEVGKAVNTLNNVIGEREVMIHELRDYITETAVKNVESIHAKIEEEKGKVVETVTQEVEKAVNTLNDAIGEREVMMQGEPERETPPTYASVARGKPKYRTLHSLIVADKENFMPTTEIVQEVGKIIEARKEGIQVDRIRKGKGRKVIVGFRDRKDRDKIINKIEKSEGKLEAQIIENKDPQVVLYGVLKNNTDDEVIEAIRSQNRHLVEDILGGGEDRINVKYRRNGRDDHTQHVVLTVSPRLWGRFTEAGHLYIDVQRVRVADQSPLIQCSRCLGYGHGRRFCSAAEEKCAHCSGAHRRAECDDLKEGRKPCCTNCEKEGLKQLDHNAFSAECPVRQKWDVIARATVAYDPEDK